jgi:hypothetical protein
VPYAHHGPGTSTRESERRRLQSTPCAASSPCTLERHFDWLSCKPTHRMDQVDKLSKADFCCFSQSLFQRATSKFQYSREVLTNTSYSRALVNCFASLSASDSCAYPYARSAALDAAKSSAGDEVNPFAVSSTRAIQQDTMRHAGSSSRPARMAAATATAIAADRAWVTLLEAQSARQGSGVATVLPPASQITPPTFQ